MEPDILASWPRGKPLLAARIAVIKPGLRSRLHRDVCRDSSFEFVADQFPLGGNQYNVAVNIRRSLKDNDQISSEWREVHDGIGRRLNQEKLRPIHTAIFVDDFDGAQNLPLGHLMGPRISRTRIGRASTLEMFP